MSGYDGRTKGKRFRKPQSGGSNVRARWKANKSLRKQKQHSKASKSGAHQQQDGRRVAMSMRIGYDIDGDGQIDVREMRLAKFLDAMMEKRYQHNHEHQGQQRQPPSESELTHMRQEAGRLLIAREFVKPNHDRLWRYGAVFTGKSEAQSAEFIAAHKNFQKLMPFLENLERRRTIRSLQNLRSCVQNGDGGGGDPNGEINGLTPRADTQEDAKLAHQTWVETSRKVYNPTFPKHPLPELQPKKKMSDKELHPVSEDPARDAKHRHSEVLFNTYGAIDVDGDGVVDDDEMKLHLRLQESTLDDTSSNHNGSGHSGFVVNPRELRQHQQLEGRKMMARDFAQRNEGQLWLYEPSYRDKSLDEIVAQIATNAQFAKEFNKLRAKERVLRLKSSMGVSHCLVQQPMTELPTDPSNAMEFRRVRHRSELLLARKELLKPSQHHAMQQQMMMQQQQQQRHSVGSAPTTAGSNGNSLHGTLRTRAVREDRRDLSRPASESQIGLPKIYDTPVRIEATGSFSVTK